MIAGHFTTALIAKQKFPKGTLLYFLIISQLQDFLWFTFHYLGLEPTNPSDAFDATLSNMAVDMLYSHDLLPQLFWLAIVFLLGKLLFKSTKIGLVSVALVSIHFVLDFFSGHMHHIFGADTMQAGLGLYASNPYLAILIEVLFSFGALWYFFKEEAKKMLLEMQQFTNEKPSKVARMHLVFLKGTYLVDTEDWGSELADINVDISDLNVSIRSQYYFLIKHFALDTHSVFLTVKNFQFTLSQRQEMTVGASKKNQLMNVVFLNKSSQTV